MNLKDISASAQSSSRRFHLPDFERDPESIARAVDATIASAENGLNEIGSRPHSEITFENTALTFDHLWCDAMEVANRIYLMKEVHPDKNVQEAATNAIKKFQEWSVGIDYREDIYLAFKYLSESEVSLSGEHEKYLTEVMRDYRRSGMSLPDAERKKVEELRIKLSNLETDFRSNITNAQAELLFTKEELSGVPDSFLNAPGIQLEDGSFRVFANVTWHSMVIMDHAKSAATRQRFLETRLSLCKEENGSLLDKIILLRQEIAQCLGYSSWAAFRTEVRMAGSPENVLKFLDNLKSGLRSKFEAELDQYLVLKKEESGDPSASIQLHDYRYYQNKFKKEKFDIDQEELRNFFPYREVLHGMFAIFGEVFGLQIEASEPDFKWADDLELFVVKDSETQTPLGALYLDMFPRDGKFNHFAQFGLIPGRKYPDGQYQCPVVALICNFALPAEGQPSLLTHNEVETLFHEFGHALHSILTQAETNRYSGTGVDHDFVEVPSQMLEFWAWDQKVLNRFARDHRDPSKTIPEDTLKRMKAAELAVKGTHYSRQASFSLLDMNLHKSRDLDQSINTISESNEILDEVFMKHPEGSAFAAYFGHLCGYDAGYYSYAWADAIAEDLNTVFKLSPQGYEDKVNGRKLRDVIYATGGSRDPNELVKEFLGREPSLDPFLAAIGAGTENSQ